MYLFILFFIFYFIILFLIFFIYFFYYFFIFFLSFILFIFFIFIFYFLVFGLYFSPLFFTSKELFFIFIIHWAWKNSFWSEQLFYTGDFCLNYGWFLFKNRKKSRVTVKISLQSNTHFAHFQLRASIRKNL